MKINWIEWRNIKGYGNKHQCINFPQPGGLWMILGKNGNGKSTLLDLPKILFYGRLNDINKQDIANRLNKHGWIRGEIEPKPGEKIIIERKFAPSDLIVYKKKNDQLIDIGKAGISNYQDYIDAEVTGLPYNIFSNIVSLSVNDFRSFISMTPKDKRIIIDKLFSMEILNKMYKLISTDMKNIKTNIDLYDKEITSLEENIKGASSELIKLKENVNQDNTQKIETLKNKLNVYINGVKEADSKLKTYQSKEQEIQSSYNEFIQRKSNLKSDYNNINNKIGLYDRDKCPTCGTDFHSHDFDLIKEELQEKKKAIIRELEEIKTAEQKYAELFKKLRSGIEKLKTYIYKAKSGYETHKTELAKLQNEKPKEFDSIRNIINKSKKKKNKRENEKQTYDENYWYLSTLSNLYSDSGIKKRVLENYLPTLNKEIEYTLNELHFPYKLKFNNDFEPELKHLGIDISVHTLSTGEKKRVDLAVLISIIRMLKQKYPSLNIFMLDEVLSSIDGDGLYDIIGILQKTSKDMNIHIFIVNHAVLPIEYFFKKIETTKNDGFSDIEITELD